MITLMLADDHQVVRQGLAALLGAVPDFKLVAEAADARTALEEIARSKPDVLVLDLAFPGPGGFEVLRQVPGVSPETRVVILSMHAEPAYVHEAFKAGAAAYVVKGATVHHLLDAIRAAVAGRQYLSPPLTPAALADYAQQAAADPFDTLTNREKEILNLTADGLSSAAIGERLFISSRTVESHRASLMRKLNFHNQRELVRYAIERGRLPAANLPSAGNSGRSRRMRRSTEAQNENAG